MAMSRRAAVALVVALLPLPLYVLRMDNVVGMMTDDGWYVLLAKSLASGTGYWLINSPLAGILPGYPPGFPALLSLAFRIQPALPENVWLLKVFSVGAMAGVGVLSYLYFERDRKLPRDVAVCAALAVTLTPALVFLATSTVMSECVFLLAQLAAVVVADRAASRPERSGAKTTVVAGVLAATAMLIRSVGIGVVAASFLLLIVRRQWKRAALFALVASIFLAPWLIHARLNAPTPQQQAIQRGSIVYGYGDQFWMRRAGSALSGRIAISELPGRVSSNVVDIAARSIGGIFAPVLLRGTDESGEEVLSLGSDFGWAFVGFGGNVANIAISLMFTIVVTWGYVRSVRQRLTVAEILVPISLAITVLWPWWTFRFILPLTPFLVLYLVAGLQSTALPSLARIVVLCMVGLHVYDHAGYILHARVGSSNVDWLKRYEEVDRTLSWMNKHVEKDAVIATTNPALVHLRTGLRTIALDALIENWNVWRDRGASVVACLIPRSLPSRSRGHYRVLFESSRDLSMRTWVISIRQ
jgi:hypothetical protein